MCHERSRVVGYFPNWARYRVGEGKFTVNEIDPSLYTHLIYSFAILDESTFSIKAIDRWADIEDGGFKNTIDLKKNYPQLKVMIALGGWTDSTDGTNKYSRLVASSQNINKFVTSVMDLFQEYKFDGLDLDWEFPKTQDDKNGFTNLMVALRKAFNQRYLLTAAVPATVDAIDKGYDVHRMNENLDFINLMAYDFHGSWEKDTADHHSPLYKRSGETNNLNTDSGVDYWINKGMPAKKITMGIPLYGRSWTLSTGITTPPAPAQGPGAAGDFTKEAGNMAYYEIRRAISKNGWSAIRDASQKIGPYAVSPTSPTSPKIWVGYDDPVMAVIKTKYILSKGLGGAMLWDISMDDFRGTYGEGRNPVTSAIVKNLRY